MGDIQLSNYAKALDADVLNRFKSKLSSVNFNNIDPYILDSCLKVKWFCLTNENFDSCTSYPEIEEIDIYNYFVMRCSFYTKSEVKAYKSLQAYNYLVSGHVSGVRWCKHEKIFLVLAKVSQSQRVSEDALDLWIVVKAEEDAGEIITAHCKCVAGNAETCSHISAVAYYFLAYHTRRRGISCTEIRLYWIQPSSSFVSPKKLENVSYKTAKKSLENLMGCESDKKNSAKGTPAINKAKLLPKKIRNLSEDPFLAQLRSAGCRNKIFRIIPPYVDQLVKEKDTFPKTYGNLYSEENDSKTLDELVKTGSNLEFTLTKEDITEITKITRDQVNSKFWFQYRTGRITASKMYSVCNVKSLSSNVSLIKGICYSVKEKFQSKATDWGCRHEKQAIEMYLQRQSTHHQKLEFEKSGF